MGGYAAEVGEKLETAEGWIRPYAGIGVAVVAVLVFVWPYLGKVVGKAKSLVKHKPAPVDLVPEPDEVQEGLEWVCRFGKAIGSQGLVTEALVEKSKRYRVGPLPAVTVTTGSGGTVQ